MRTSISHPLQIVEAETGQPGYGLIGVTFCPGKYDPYRAKV
jgi:ADP-ribosyl-[dinitrogen reductase] hydrolase